jgi:hypothetical protein
MYQNYAKDCYAKYNPKQVYFLFMSADYTASLSRCARIVDPFG